MSRVQSALGPDRRISANAKMFDGQLAEGIGRLETSALSNYNWWEEPMGITRADTNEIDSAIGQNRYWVGVWDARLGYSPDKIKREQQREQREAPPSHGAARRSNSAAAESMATAAGSAADRIKIRPASSTFAAAADSPASRQICTPNCAR